MLNADMSLIKDIGNPSELGEVSCGSTCPESSYSRAVEEFAVNNDLWLEKFGDAWNKMIMTG